jgi:aspartate carbamoyltransferase
VTESSSSAVKGETFEDTIRVLEQYADAIVIRHPQIGKAAQAASVASIPIINAGDGAGEHPTQALLDLFCMRSLKGKIDGLTITIVGDLKFGRTIHSLARLFALFNNVKVNFVSTGGLRLPDEVRSEIAGRLQYTESNMDQLSAKIAEADVLYATRIQKERFVSEEAYLAEKGSYCISTYFLDQANAKKDLAVMHPLPRIDEIAASFDRDPRAAYFKQVRFGMIARMAILSEVLRA